jgi:Ca2+-binding RTX toxin-like protein
MSWFRPARPAARPKPRPVLRVDELGPRVLPAVTAVFIPGQGTLAVHGDAADNAITVSRDAAGNLLVNGGAVPIRGGTATVANTARIHVFGRGGNDTVTLDEANGALPAANLFGGAGNDTLTGGSGNDRLFGEAGNDTVLGKAGDDLLFGGAGDDVLTAGRGNDQVFGQAGNDRMIWNPGDGSALNEGGAGVDTVEVNGGNVAEQFTAAANGARVRFDRVNPAPFFLDIGTSENLQLNMNGGDDSFSATGNLANLIQLAVDGGVGNDTILGGNGADRLSGGDGNDFIDGNQGNDLVFLGAGDDTFQWDPGDNSDVVEGGDGADTMLFNGANIDESFEASANGERVRFTRDIGNVVMDLNDIETITLNALGGVDAVTVDDLTGTDVTEVNLDLGAGDGGADTVVVNGTYGDDAVVVAGDATGTSVVGLAARVNVTGAEAANDRLTISAQAGDDAVDAEDVAAGAVGLTIDGGAGDDNLTGGAGDDNLLGGDGDDVLAGGPGNDALDGGAGDNVLIQ